MVELAASTHAGIIRHSFPRNAEMKHVLVDVSHFLPSTRGLGIEQHYVEGSIKVHGDGHYTGYGVYNGGWNYGMYHRHDGGLVLMGNQKRRIGRSSFAGSSRHRRKLLRSRALAKRLSHSGKSKKYRARNEWGLSFRSPRHLRIISCADGAHGRYFLDNETPSLSSSQGLAFLGFLRTKPASLSTMRYLVKAMPMKH